MQNNDLMSLLQRQICRHVNKDLQDLFHALELNYEDFTNRKDFGLIFTTNENMVQFRHGYLFGTVRNVNKKCVLHELFLTDCCVY